MSEFPSTFGRIIRERRTRGGLSQEELADRAGLHRTYVSMIERGTRQPSLEVVGKLARGLGITASELVAATERGERTK